jgi:hypothetical protein
MAPEYLTEAKTKVDRRSDIYSLGVALYELATGTPLFDVETDRDFKTRLILAEPERPRKRDPELPPQLEAVIEKAISRNPDDRYATAAEFAEDLLAFSEGRPLPHAALKSGSSRLASGLRRHWKKVAAAAAGAIAIGVGVIAYFQLAAPVVEHCRPDNLVERNGVPVCVEPVESPPDGFSGFRLTIRGGKVVEMVRLGAPVAPGSVDLGKMAKARRWRFEYADNGRILERQALGDGDQVLSIHRFAFDDPTEEGAGARLTSDLLDETGAAREEAGSKVARRVLVLDADGLAIEERFMTRFGSPTKNARGHIGYRYVRDADGRIRSRQPIEASQE